MTTANPGSRERLLSTAKRLLAEQGLDGVSLREIIREAGIKHATAVQYHFGDREGLVAAIIEPHDARVNTRREAMLDDYEANAIPDCRTVAAIMVRPLARELEDQEGRYFLRVYAQVIQRVRGLYPNTGTSLWRWRRQADRFIPVGTADFHPRYSALTFTTVELARRASEPAHVDDRLFVSRLIDVVASILQTPSSTETERLYRERHARQVEAEEDQIA
jgi:AcrR family transcriptional regulator